MRAAPPRWRYAAARPPPPIDVTLRTIVSGGQTGVDRAALDVAIMLGFAHGGWCPAGRLAEDGPIDAHYALRETASAAYDVRTERNVVDSDGTLVLASGEPRGAAPSPAVSPARTGSRCWSSTSPRPHRPQRSTPGSTPTRSRR